MKTKWFKSFPKIIKELVTVTNSRKKKPGELRAAQEKVWIAWGRMSKPERSYYLQHSLTVTGRYGVYMTDT